MSEFVAIAERILLSGDVMKLKKLASKFNRLKGDPRYADAFMNTGNFFLVM